MDINCTLLVQCLNFGIAYVILSRLIFKPVIESIFEERAKYDALQRALHGSQAAIEELEAKRNALWQHAQSYFGDYLRKIPYTEQVMPFSYQYEYESATDAQVDAHVQRVHDVIMKKVSDDFK